MFAQTVCMLTYFFVTGSVFGKSIFPVIAKMPTTDFHQLSYLCVCVCVDKIYACKYVYMYAYIILLDVQFSIKPYLRQIFLNQTVKLYNEFAA